MSWVSVLTLLRARTLHSTPGIVIDCHHPKPLDHNLTQQVLHHKLNFKKKKTRLKEFHWKKETDCEAVVGFSDRESTLKSHGNFSVVRDFTWIAYKVEMTEGGKQHLPGLILQ